MSKITKEQKFWDQYAEIYDILLILKAYRVLMADMLKAANIVPGMRVADFGCGTGNFLTKVYQVFGNTVRGFGFDHSGTMLEHARSKLVHSEYSFKQLDLSSEFDLGLRFNCILCSQVLYALPDPEASIKMLKRHLHPGGKIVLVNPDSEQFMGLILMAQYDQTPKDIERWRTNDLEMLHTLAYELFGEISVVEVAQEIPEDYIALALQKFGPTPIHDILFTLGEINAEIVRRAQKGGGYYFTSNRMLTKYVEQAGFSIVHTSRTYGKQCHLMVAQPKR